VATTEVPPPAVEAGASVGAARGGGAADDGGIEAPPRRGRLSPFVRSARARILASYLVLLAFSTIASVVAIRQLLLVRLDTRIDRALVQEGEEFRRLAGGRDPLTGEPFGTNARRIFDTYLARNVPSYDQALITLLGGRPYRAARTERAAFALERDAALISRWSALDRSTASRLETRAGPARVLAIPVRSGNRTVGAFVAVNFLAEEQDHVDEAVQTAGAVGLAVLVLASLLAFFAAGRVLAPLRELDSTARSISDSDLTRRIEVEGEDEIAELGWTFNGMLDRLEAAFSSQRNFISDAGHELRTPITIVRGHLELLGDDDDPEERRETVALVTDELDRMSRFVDELMVLARAERPDFLRLEAVALGPLAGELLAKARTLGPQSWELEVAGPGVIVADRQRLTQAVMNLAENAVRHTPDNTEIALGASLEEGTARIWVSDNGPGIPLKDQARVFERMWRGRGRSRGTGLGLTIVRAIAAAHGGRVELKTRPGDGTRFTIVIPAHQPDEGPT